MERRRLGGGEPGEPSLCCACPVATSPSSPAPPLPTASRQGPHHRAQPQPKRLAQRRRPLDGAGRGVLGRGACGGVGEAYGCG